MKAKFTFKANDDKAIEIRVTKWGYRYMTSDEHIPEIRQRYQKIKDDYALKNDGNQGAFMTSSKKPAFKVVFSRKMVAKLPKEYREAGYRYPTDIILKDPYYNVVDRVIFINFFTEAILKK